MIPRRNTPRSVRHSVGTRVNVTHSTAGHYATGVITGYVTRFGDERYTIDTNAGVMTPVVYPERFEMGNAFTVEPV